MIQISLKWTNWTLQKTNTALLCIPNYSGFRETNGRTWTLTGQHQLTGWTIVTGHGQKQKQFHLNCWASCYVTVLFTVKLRSNEHLRTTERPESYYLDLHLWIKTFIQNKVFVHFEPKIIILEHLSKRSVNSQQKSYLEWMCFWRCLSYRFAIKCYWKKNLIWSVVVRSHISLHCSKTDYWSFHLDTGIPHWVCLTKPASRTGSSVLCFNVYYG